MAETSDSPSKPRCESCGLLMLDAGEHGAGNPENPRCRLCTGPDGSFLAYEQTLASHAHYLRAKAGSGPEEALEAARRILAGNPAWEGRSPRPDEAGPSEEGPRDPGEGTGEEGGS